MYVINVTRLNMKPKHVDILAVEDQANKTSYLYVERWWLRGTDHFSYTKLFAQPLQSEIPIL